MSDSDRESRKRKHRRAYGTGGIFQKVNSAGEVTQYISYRCAGKTIKESTQSSREADAERLLQKRQREVEDGLSSSPLKVKVNDLLDDLLSDYKVHERSSLKTVTSHIEGKEYGLRKLFGHMKPKAVTKPLLTKTMEHWKSLGLEPATINKHLGTLCRAYNLGVENGRISAGTVPPFPHLEENNARQTYVGPADVDRLIRELPADIDDLVGWLHASSQRWGDACSQHTRSSMSAGNSQIGRAHV